MKKLTILLITAVMLFLVAATANAANTVINRKDIVTGQGSLKVSGYLYAKTKGGGVIVADVYREVNGTEQHVAKGSRLIDPGNGPRTVKFDFSIDGLPQDTYIVRYSYGGNLSSITFTGVRF